MQQQSNPNRFEDDLRTTSNILYLVINAHALCITMFIRHSFGANMPGITGVVSAIMLLLMTACQQHGEFFWYLVAWIFALMCQKARTNKLANLGYHGHSRYAGWPWVGFLLGAKTEYAAKLGEPTLCLVLGLFLVPVSKELAAFVASGFVSLLILLLSDQVGNRREITAMRDLRIEQQQLSERMRGSRRDF